MQVLGATTTEEGGRCSSLRTENREKRNSSRNNRIHSNRKEKERGCTVRLFEMNSLKEGAV
jgi:hypothetical protein